MFKLNLCKMKIEDLKVDQEVYLKWIGYALPHEFSGAKAKIEKIGRKRITVSSNFLHRNIYYINK